METILKRFVSLLAIMVIIVMLLQKSRFVNIQMLRGEKINNFRDELLEEVKFRPTHSK